MFPLRICPHPGPITTLSPQLTPIIAFRLQEQPPHAGAGPVPDRYRSGARSKKDGGTDPCDGRRGGRWMEHRTTHLADRTATATATATAKQAKSASAPNVQVHGRLGALLHACAITQVTRVVEAAPATMVTRARAGPSSVSGTARASCKRAALPCFASRMGGGAGGD